MKNLLKLCTVIGILLFTSKIAAQPYVKFEEQPPMEIVVKETRIHNLMIKYNVPSKSVLYVILKKDGKAIGNNKIDITRGKRVVKVNLSIWEENEITRKGDYSYELKILQKENAWNEVVAKAEPVTGVVAIKKKK